MSDQEAAGEGWAPNVPSARKSIHSHENCIFVDCYHTMGRYGLKERRDVQNKSDSSNQDQGIDEVDNVLSKFARQPSPLKERKRNRERRNSLSTPYRDSIEHDTDSNLLAKSLPADLPSYYCSDQFAHQSLPTEFYNEHNSSTVSSHASNNSTNYKNNSFALRNLGLSEESTIREETIPNCNKTSYKKVILPIFGLLSIAAAVYYDSILNVAMEKKNIHDDIKFTQEMNYLGEKYQISDHSILELQTGISTISERNDTGSFIFVYNSKSDNFDHEQFNNFMEDVALAAAKYLRNDTRSTHPTIVQSSQLTMKTHSELMNRYRNEVAKTGVMLVKDIDKVPSSLAMAFHYFCDEYNPLVAKTAIFFTLNLERCASNISEQTSTYINIEKCLANKWNTIPKDNMKPLLARVVNVIVDLSTIM